MYNFSYIIIMSATIILLIIILYLKINSFVYNININIKTLSIYSASSKKYILHLSQVFKIFDNYGGARDGFLFLN